MENEAAQQVHIAHQISFFHDPPIFPKGTAAQQKKSLRVRITGLGVS